MNLTQQFLIISILPFSFIGMAVYLWRTGTRRRQVLGRWFVTLILAAVWAGSILRFFGGRSFSKSLVFSWGVVGTYAFSLTIIGLLLTTFRHIGTPVNQNRVALSVSVFLWIASVAIDPQVWPYKIAGFVIAGQPINHFDLWASLWVTSWLIPIIAAFISTQRVNVGLPNSLYRNQVQYWLLVLFLFFIGSLLNSIQQPGQPGWQEIGVIITIMAGVVGTLSITQTHLPDLQLGIRQLLSRLSGTLIIFFLMLAFLWFFVRVLVNLPDSGFNASGVAAATTIVVMAPDDLAVVQSEEFILNGNGNRGTALEIVVNNKVVGHTIVEPDGKWSYPLTLDPGAYAVDIRIADNSSIGTAVSAQNLILVIASFLVALLFTFVFRLTSGLMRRLFFPALAHRDTAISDYEKSIGYLPDPMQLGDLFLRIVRSNVGTDDAWFFVTENGPGGNLMLRSLTSIGTDQADGISFSNDSPMTTYFRNDNRPLSQYDIDTLDNFADMTPENRETLASWQRVLYLSLRAGQHLVGVVALGAKSSGEAYDRQDNELLQRFGEQFAPLLAQAQNLAGLQHVNDFVYDENQSLVREQQHLRELVGLYDQFMKLVSPELRHPFSDINQKLQSLRESTNDGKVQSQVDAVSQQVESLKVPIDNLITLSARIQVRNQFDFALVDMEDVAQNAIRKLTTMADARRVSIEFNAQTALPAVYGDAAQLQEAVQYLLHNAIKFNKIGGVVQLDCGVEGSNLYLRVIDTGVGIPEDRLEDIWNGLAGTGKNGSRRGTGLGLALTRFIIAAHGGYVETESKYGSGSVFAFYLPLVFEE